MQTIQPAFDPSTLRAIIGLGNPGPRYARTRHNIGFMVADACTDALGLTWKSFDLMDRADRQALIIIKPQTFMNTSGKVVSFLKKKGIKPAQVLVIHDELEKPFGKVSLRFGGSPRGHNGLRSLIDAMGKEFWRLRVGIGRPEDKDDVPEYVLRPFGREEQLELEHIIVRARDMILRPA